MNSTTENLLTIQIENTDKISENIRMFFFNTSKSWFLEVFTYGWYRSENFLKCVPIRINSTAIESIDVGLFNKPKIIVKLLLSFENHHLEVGGILDFRGFPKVFLGVTGVSPVTPRKTLGNPRKSKIPSNFKVMVLETQKEFDNNFWFVE